MLPARTTSANKTQGQSVINSPLYRFPAAHKRRVSSSSSASSRSTSSSSGASSDASLSTPPSPSVSSASSNVGSEDEWAIKSEIRHVCIGKQGCKCEHCHIGDFIFETEEEFREYYEILQATQALGISHGNVTCGQNINFGDG